MKMQHFLSIALLCFAVMLPAQNDDFPAVILSCQGKVQYISADKTSRLKVKPGAVFKKDGTIKITGNGQAVVYGNGRIQRFRGKGDYALPEVFKSGGMASLNFDPEFGKYVRAAVEFTASKHAGDGWGNAVTDPKQGGDGWGNAVTDPKQGGDGWGTAVTDPKQGGDGWGNAVTDPKQGGDGWGNAVTDPKQGGDGWGGQGSRIALILPFGKLTPAATRFVWSKPTGADRYQLDILDENGKALHSVAASDTSAMVELGRLSLSPDRIYAWKISVPGNDKLVSATREFALSAPEAQAEALKRVAGSATYRDGNPVLRGLMEAVALEKAEWYNAAGQRYEALLGQFPKDNMLRMMYAAFWMRYGLEPKARAVLK